MKSLVRVSLDAEDRVGFWAIEFWKRYNAGEFK
jgi:hypothetical protein